MDADILRQWHHLEPSGSKRNVDPLKSQAYVSYKHIYVYIWCKKSSRKSKLGRQKKVKNVNIMFKQKVKKLYNFNICLFPICSSCL